MNFKKNIQFTVPKMDLLKIMTCKIFKKKQFKYLKNTNLKF